MSSRRQSFAEQMMANASGIRRRSSLMMSEITVGEEHEGTPAIAQEDELSCQVQGAVSSITAPFESKFEPEDMRQLALVAHNHMKPAM